MKTYRYMIGMLLSVWLLAACDNSNAFDEYAKFDTTAQTAWGPVSYTHLTLPTNSRV